MDLNIPDHYMFWAACNLAYFGFLYSSKFTGPNLVSFSQDVHLSVEDIAVDSYKLPTSLCICFTVSKTYPFRKGCLIHNRGGNSPLGTVQLLMAYLTSVLGLSY